MPLNVIFKTMLPLIMITNIVLRKSYRANYVWPILAIILMAYNLLTVILNSDNLSIGYMLTGFTSLFYFFYLFILLSFADRIVSEEIAEKLLLFLLCCSATLGISQAVLNTPIVSLSSANGTFKVLSWIFYGNLSPQIRGFSLSSNAFDFGLFLIFSVGLLVFKLMYFKNKFTYIIIGLLVVAAIYSTFTRNIYLGGAIAVPAVILFNLTRIKYKRALYFLPIASLIIGIGVTQGSNLTGKGFSDTQSLQIRTENWKQIVRRTDGNNMRELLFGEGIYQSEDAGQSMALLVDNTYLHTIIHQGILGLFLLIVIYLSILRYVIRSIPSAFNSALFGLIATWPALATYNIYIYQIGLFAILAVIVSGRDIISNRYVL